MNGLVWRLLRKNISKAQVATYFTTLLCGITLVMLAIQFHRDASRRLSPDVNTPHEYITLSKTVDRSGFSSNGFSQSEIEQLRREPWVDSVAPYLSGDFSVMLSMEIGMPFTTQMFLEAVPEEFLDTIPERWSYKPDARIVPLIIPRDYLTLYNYGFASSQSLPKLSENTLMRLPLTLELSGNGKSKTYSARITGFSSRINSVIAPEEFIRYATEEYGEGDVEPTKLIVKTLTDNSSINRYLEENHLERSGEGIDTTLLQSAVTLLTTLLIAIGTVIIALSIIIQLLCLYLLVEKNRDTTRRLIMLGYSPASLRRYYLRFIMVSNLVSFVVAALITPLCARLWHRLLPSDGFTLLPCLAGLLIALLLTLPVIPLLRRAIR